MEKKLYKQNNPVVNDAFDRLAVKIHLKKQKEGLKTFLICGCEPTVGTTTICIDLAISMASAGWKTLLVDCDMRKKPNDKRLNDKSEVGLFECLSGDADLDEIVCYTNHDYLCYIPNGKGTEKQVNYLCSEKMEKFLEKWKEEYDYVIIDAPALASVVDSSILASQVDGVVMVAALQSTSKNSIAQAYETLKGVDANILGIVANKLNKKEYKKHVNDYDYFTKKKYKTVEGK